MLNIMGVKLRATLTFFEHRGNIVPRVLRGCSQSNGSQIIGHHEIFRASKLHDIEGFKGALGIMEVK